MHTHFFGMRQGRDCRFGGRERDEAPYESQREQRSGTERDFRGHRHGGPEHGFGSRGFFGRGFGERRGRLFDAGDLKLVILKLLSEQPSYGYQLIKTMEQRLSGSYAPSPGVIYPTLTMLEEEGLASGTSENNKKVYSVTAEGTGFLEANQGRITELFDRMEETGRGYQRGRSPEVMKAFMNLRGAVAAKVSRDTVTPEQIVKITEAIHATAKIIDEL